MQYPWDEDTRDRQKNLLVLLAICIVSLGLLYLFTADPLEDQKERRELNEPQDMDNSSQ